MSISVDPAASAAFFSEMGRARIPPIASARLPLSVSSQTAREVEKARARERAPQLCDEVEASARAAGRTSDTAERSRVSCGFLEAVLSALTVCGCVETSP